MKARVRTRSKKGLLAGLCMAASVSLTGCAELQSLWVSLGVPEEIAYDYAVEVCGILEGIGFPVNPPISPGREAKAALD